MILVDRAEHDVVVQIVVEVAVQVALARACNTVSPVKLLPWPALNNVQSAPLNMPSSFKSPSAGVCGAGAKRIASEGRSGTKGDRGSGPPIK